MRWVGGGARAAEQWRGQQRGVGGSGRGRGRQRSLAVVSSFAWIKACCCAWRSRQAWRARAAEDASVKCGWNGAPCGRLTSPLREGEGGAARHGAAFRLRRRGSQGTLDRPPNQARGGCAAASGPAVWRMPRRCRLHTCSGRAAERPSAARRRQVVVIRVRFSLAHATQARVSPTGTGQSRGAICTCCNVECTQTPHNPTVGQQINERLADGGRQQMSASVSLCRGQAAGAPGAEEARWPAARRHRIRLRVSMRRTACARQRACSRRHAATGGSGMSAASCTQKASLEKAAATANAAAFRCAASRRNAGSQRRQQSLVAAIAGRGPSAGRPSTCCRAPPAAHGTRGHGRSERPNCSLGGQSAQPRPPPLCGAPAPAYQARLCAAARGLVWPAGPIHYCSHLAAAATAECTRRRAVPCCCCRPSCQVLARYRGNAAAVGQLRNPALPTTCNPDLSSVDGSAEADKQGTTACHYATTPKKHQMQTQQRPCPASLAARACGR